MKFKLIAVISAATALSLGMVGSAAASPLSSKPAPQVTGADCSPHSCRPRPSETASP